MEFEDYIAGRDKALSDLFEKAEKPKEMIVGVGETEKERDRAQKLYRIIRKLATHPEAKSIVAHVQHNNPLTMGGMEVACGQVRPGK